MIKDIKTCAVWLILISITLLTGCNDNSGDSGDSFNQNKTEKPPEVELVLTAENVLSPIQNNLPSIVNLISKVHSNTNKESNVINNVTAVTNTPIACQKVKVKVNESGYTLSNAKGFVGVCVYQYRASNTTDATVTVNAYSVVAIQSDVNGDVELFAPISESTLIDTPINIDLKNLLIGQIPDDYTLNKDVTLIGSGSSDVNTAEEIITFTPEGIEGGYARIIYYYSDGNNIKMGNISISVSLASNGAPEADDFNYSPDPKIMINVMSVIDLDDHVRDPDGDELQLVDMNSLTASVTSSDPTNMENIKMNFISTVPGKQYIYYVISDHFGGYATGMIGVEVYDPLELADWGDLQQNMNIYYGPLTKGEADAGGINYSSSVVDKNGYTVVTFNASQAETFCSGLGRLPTKDELVELSNIGGIGPSQYNNWPVSIGYYAKDDSTFSMVDLSSGLAVDGNAGGQYVTCVGEGGFVIDSKMSDLDAVSDGTDKALVVTRLTFNGEPITEQSISASVTGSATIDNASVVTDSDGYARFYFTNIKSEIVTVNVEFNEQTRTTSVTFIGDKSTAEISTFVSVDYQSADSGTNEMEVTLKDANNNPVAGEVISFDADTNVSVNTSEPTTNSNGVQIALITWKGDPETQGDPTVTVTSNYTRPDGVTVSAENQFTFKSISLGHLDPNLTAILDNSDVFGNTTNIVSALVTDENGQPAAGVQVTFYLTDVSPEISFTSGGNPTYASTDSNGIAITSITFTAKKGVYYKPEHLKYNVKATLSDSSTNPLPMSFTQDLPWLSKKCVGENCILQLKSAVDGIYQTCASFNPRFRDFKDANELEIYIESGSLFEAGWFSYPIKPDQIRHDYWDLGFIIDGNHELRAWWDEKPAHIPDADTFIVDQPSTFGYYHNCIAPLSYVEGE